MSKHEGTGWRTIGAGFALALLVAIAVLAYRSTTGFEEHARRVSHTHTVQLEIEELQGMFSRLRTHWRLYLASGDPAHRTQFDLEQHQIPIQVSHLRQLTADHPAQQRRLHELDAVLAADLGEIAALAEARHAGKIESPQTIVALLAAERPALSEVVRIAREMHEEEALLLRAREERTAASSRFTKGVIALGSLLALALLGSMLFVLARENRERRNAEAEARRKERELDDLFNHAPCGYHSVDADGRIVRINDTWLAWLGYSREEVVGRMQHPDLMTEASAQHFRETAFPLFKQQGWLKEMEFDYRRKDGSTIPGSLSATTIRDAHDNYAMSRSVVIDISARKRIEAELQASNRELESFSYSVSHDLRAPLRAVNGYAKMLEEDYGAQLDDEGRRLLATVRESAARMGRLIDDLLAFSRLGRQPIVPASVDMTELARQVLDEQAAGFPHVHAVLGELPAAAGDRALLRQVWANLIGNALKYSSKSAQPLVDIGGRSEAGECVYAVRDNGAGFDMRYYDKLFGVFQRLHAESEFEGTGVGLAIVQRIVLRHGGRVWAQGEPGKGATFNFALPARRGHHV